MPTSMTDRLAAVRAHMKRSRLDAYVVPAADQHQSEYVPNPWQRRAWLSGFDGSAGDFVVTHDLAMLWTDGRYWLQAERQLRDAGAGATLMKAGAPGVPAWEAWLAALPKGSRVGVDPRVITVKQRSELEAAFAPRGVALECIDDNLVDAAWSDRPPMPASPVRAHPVRIAGKSAADKIRDLRAALAAKGADAHVVSSLDAVAWLFNLRGADVECNPVFVAYAIITPSRATLYTNPARVPDAARQTFAGAADIREYDRFEADLREAAGAHAWWIDDAATSAWAASILGVARVVERGRSPVVLAKGVKKEAELAGMRAAHQRDAVAMAKFLRWLEDVASRGGQTEVSAAAHLRALRASGDSFIGLSFESISGYGPNGAIVHYRPSADNPTPIGADAVYLIDSGGQYEDGTTDVTRTLHLGRPTDEQRDRFTRVLKGHIALATARFPKGTRGVQLDAFARRALWDVGLDYAHGTGHGVGAALSVHEWPPNISARPVANAALEPGMVFSNEPGCYAEGRYGIRIENLEVVVEDPEHAGFCRLRPLTLVPIQTKMLDRALLRTDEIAWLNAYHRRVHDEIGPLLDPGDRAWLAAAVAPI